jgi:SAM-dependent methyltransferase
VTRDHGPFEPISFYEQPALYDALHWKGTTREVRRVEKLYERYTSKQSRKLVWLDPACGTGRHLRAAVLRGHHAVGVDRSRPMLDFARRRLSAIDPRHRRYRLIEGDMTSFARSVPWPVDIAIGLVGSVQLIPSDQGLKSHLHDVWRVLAPGGIYVVEVSPVDRSVARAAQFHFATRRRTTEIDWTIRFEKPRRRVLSVRSKFYVKAGRRVERYAYEDRLRSYTPAEMRRALLDSPFRLTAILDDGHEELSEIPGDIRRNCVLILTRGGT